MEYETWLNSPELQKEVERDVKNWGRWSRGGFPSLGFDSKANFEQSLPEDEAEERLLSSAVDVDSAERIEKILTILYREHTPIVWALKARYAQSRTINGVGKGLKATFRIEANDDKVRAIIDEGLFLVAMTGG